MTKAVNYRQGDVLLIKVEDREDLTNEVSSVLAEGEVSGHKHEIVGGSVVTLDLPRFSRQTFVENF